MDIGKKLRDARNAAGLTQESAAESLGVSRQSVSNWETGKTYPDIVSVIKMSGLYSVSLDCLLKEEKPVSNDLNYLNYLEESTNTVKSRRRLGKLVLVAAYLVIWAVSVAFFWLAVSGSDAGAYAVLVIWGAIPLTTFVISLLIGANGYWGRKKMVGCAYPRSYVHSNSVSDLHPRQRRFDGHFRRRHNDAPRRPHHPAHRRGRLRRRSCCRHGHREAPGAQKARGLNRRLGICKNKVFCRSRQRLRLFLS